MKKIISFLIVATMLLSFALVGSATDKPTLTLAITEVSDPTFAVGTTFKLVVSYSGLNVAFNDMGEEGPETYAGDSLSGISFKINVPGFGSTIKGSGLTYATDELQKVIMSTATKNMSGEVYSYVQSLSPDNLNEAFRTTTDAKVLTLKFKVNAEIKEDIAFTIDKAVANTYISTITYDEEGNKVRDNVYSDSTSTLIIDDSAAKIVVEKEEPAADTVAMSAAPVFTAEAVKSTENEGWQKGQAVINTFKLGDIKNFINMGWKLSFVDETYADRYATLGDDKFAQIITDLGSVDDTADVEFVAAFVVNEKDAEGNVIDHIIKAVETALYDGSKVFTAVAPAN